MDLDTKIVFVHRGRSWYLPYALYQAKHSSPDSDVVLLGDSGGYEGIGYAALDKLSGADAARFQQAYVHMSTLSEEFESVCFLRWFYLLEYMRSEGVRSVMCLDSDVLLYSSMPEIMGVYGRDKRGCACFIPRQQEESGAASAHISFWTREWLEKFCDFILQCYSIPKYLNKLKGFWKDYMATGMSGGICDMTVLYLFCRENISSVLNLAVDREGSVFNNNINSASAYEPDEYTVTDGMKKVRFANRKPLLFKSGRDGVTIRAHALHFQGDAKGYMPHYYTGGSFMGKASSDMMRLLYPFQKSCKAFVKKLIRYQRVS